MENFDIETHSPAADDKACADKHSTLSFELAENLIRSYEKTWDNEQRDELVCLLKDVDNDGPCFEKRR